MQPLTDKSNQAHEYRMTPKIVVILAEILFLVTSGLFGWIVLLGGGTFQFGLFAIKAYHVRNPLILLVIALALRRVLAGSFWRHVVVFETLHRLARRWCASPPFRKRVLVAVSLFGLLTGLTLALQPMQPGLTGAYYQNPAWRGRPFLTVRENRFDLSRMRADFPAIKENYSIGWTGVIWLPKTGDYHLLTSSDDGSELWLDHRLVVDNRGRHGVQAQEAAIFLAAGFHSICIRYMQGDEGAALNVLWKAPGKGWEELSEARLFADIPLHAASFWLYRLRELLLALLLLGWGAALLVCGCALCGRILRNLPQPQWSVAVFLLLPLTALFLLQLAASLKWRLAHDTPIFHYIAWLMDQYGAIPYKDIFEPTGLPGTLCFHLAIGKLFGYGDLPFRLVDVVLLSGLCMATFLFMKQFGGAAGWASAVLFGLSYLLYGPIMSLQRDYLGVILIAGALLCLLQPQASRTCLRAFGIGMFFGCAFLIKPHLIIGLPVILIGFAKASQIPAPRGSRQGLTGMGFHAPVSSKTTDSLPGRGKGRVPESADCARPCDPPQPLPGGEFTASPCKNPYLKGEGIRVAARIFLAAAAGFAFPVTFTVCWLLTKDAFGAFLDSTFEAIPLYSQITGTSVFFSGSGVHLLYPKIPGSSTTISGDQRLIYLWYNFSNLGRYQGWLPAAAFGVYLALRTFSRQCVQRVYAQMTWVLAVAYSLYPVLAGKFWAYHYMPFLYFLLLTVSLSLSHIHPSAPRRRTRLKTRHLFSVVVFVISLFLSIDLLATLDRVVTQLDRAYVPPAPEGGRCDEIANWLRLHLRPGDLVQPLDVVDGGVIHAMLMTRTRIATKFIADMHFYHHVNDPYIQQLRREFLRELQAARPRVIIDALFKPYFSGPDATGNFPELQQFLAEQYVIVVNTPRYRIYERK